MSLSLQVQKSAKYSSYIFANRANDKCEMERCKISYCTLKQLLWAGCVSCGIPKCFPRSSKNWNGSHNEIYIQQIFLL